MLQDLRYSLRAFAKTLMLAAGLWSVGAAQRTPSVKDVMKKAAAYVEAYGERAAIVVGSERYTQESRGNVGPDIDKTRFLLADFALVKVDAIRGWLGFRDVLEVDGERQTDREDRLAHLLSSAGDYAEARRLSDEGARFNIGLVQRNYNVPTTALFFFRPDSVDRFKFTAKSVAADGTWQIAFKETDRPTFIRTPNGESVPSEGEIWVNPAEGTILRTVLKTELLPGTGKGQRGTGRVDVTYRFVDTLGMWLPASMDEEFEVNTQGGKWARLNGHAVYSNYRKFTTSGRIK